MLRAIQRSLAATALLVCYGTAMGQNHQIFGVVIDGTTKAALPGVYVMVSPFTDSSKVIGTATDTNGRFRLIVAQAGKYHMKVSSIGYTSMDINVGVLKDMVSVDTVRIQTSTTQLSGVTINADRPPVEQRGDTLQFNSENYKTNPDATAEDLVTKMPGVTSDNGTVKVNGEQVTKVLVDGKPFYGDDPTLALKNLPAEVIDNIQVFDKLSDQAEFTGFDDGNTQKTMNISTKKGKNNGMFGKVFGGYGFDGTDSRYLVGGNYNLFDGDRRISILELSNNVNQQNFASQDLLGISGGRGRGGGNSTGNFLVGQQSGVSTTHAVGLNYSDVWGRQKKVKITGSYFFNYSDNINNSVLNRSYLLPSENGLKYQEADTSESKNYNHRVNFRIEYTIDSSNSLIITPKFNFQRNNATSLTIGDNTLPGDITESTTNTNNPANNKGYDFNNNMVIRHKFKKKGRTISLNVGTDVNNKNSNTSLYSINGYNTTLVDSNLTNQLTNQQTGSNTNGYMVSANLSYTEPAGKTGQIMLNYGPSYTRNNTDRETNNFDSTIHEYSILDTALSNKFNSNYLTNKGGAAYRVNIKKTNLMVGVNYQYATLMGAEIYPTSYQADRSFSSILPQMTLNVKFTKLKNLRVMFRTSTNVPSIGQLQNVVNNSNPLMLSTGNPNLKQDYEPTLTARYGQTNPDKGTSLFLFVYGNYAHDYVGNSTLIPTKDTTLSTGTLLKRGSQLTLPVNLDGYWNARGSLTFGKLISKIKCNLNLTTGYTFTRTPGLINNVVNFASTHALSQGIVLSSNISEKIDFTISTTVNYNIVRNSLLSQAGNNNNYFSQVSTAKFNWIIWKGLFFNTQLSHTYYVGLSQAYDQSYFLWSLAAGYKFLKDKSLELKASVFDVLGQNRSISRTVTETYIQDSRTNVLTRYYMLTLTYTLRRFKNKNADIFNNPDGDRPRGDRPQRFGGGRPDGGGGGQGE